MAKITDRTKGLLVMMTSVLFISPDAVVTRFLSVGGAHPWTIIFWKMLFVVPVATGFAVYDAGGVSTLGQQISDGRRYFFIAVPLNAFVDTCFTLSFVYTSAANALLLINLNPMWCALAGWFILGDELPIRTYVALVLALGCVLIIFVPELMERNEGIEDTTAVELGDSSPLGNIIALFTGLGLASFITLVRHASMRETPVDLIGSTGLSAALAATVALAVRRGDVLPSSYWRVGEDAPLLWQFWLASVAQGVAVGIMFICITVAPRLITGAEVGLIVLLEAVLGPLFVFLAYGEVPSSWTILGGSLLLTVLAIHEAAPLFGMAQRSISRRITKQRPSTIKDLELIEEQPSEEKDENSSGSPRDSAKATTKEADVMTSVPVQESEC